MIGMEYFGRWGFYKLFEVEGRIDRARATKLELAMWLLRGGKVKNESNKVLPNWMELKL